jgi:hypothetical protein
MMDLVKSLMNSLNRYKRPSGPLDSIKKCDDG